MQELSDKIEETDYQIYLDYLTQLADELEVVDIRIGLDGTVYEGHWIDDNVARALPTGNGFKFKLKKHNALYYIKNLDYGWFRNLEYRDEGGSVYDVRYENVQGFDFDEEPFGTVEAAIQKAVEWLNKREQEHKRREEERKDKARTGKIW